MFRKAKKKRNPENGWVNIQIRTPNHDVFRPVEVFGKTSVALSFLTVSGFPCVRGKVSIHLPAGWRTRAGSRCVDCEGSSGTSSVPGRSAMRRRGCRRRSINLCSHLGAVELCVSFSQVNLYAGGKVIYFFTEDFSSMGNDEVLLVQPFYLKTCGTSNNSLFSGVKIIIELEFKCL